MCETCEGVKLLKVVVQISANADMCFIYSPRLIDRTSETIPFLLELRYEAQYPSKYCSMSEMDATLSHHVAKVAVTKLVGDIPAHAKNNNR